MGGHFFSYTAVMTTQKSRESCVAAASQSGGACGTGGAHWSRESILENVLDWFRFFFDRFQILNSQLSTLDFMQSHGQVALTASQRFFAYFAGEYAGVTSSIVVEQNVLAGGYFLSYSLQ